MTENTGRTYKIRIIAQTIVRTVELKFNPEIQAQGGTAK